MTVSRNIQPIIQQYFFQGKVIILYGPRQAGKTTLAKQIASQYEKDTLFLNCDEPDIQAALTNKTSTELFHFFQGKKLIILDEAQRIQNIGLTLKLIVDANKDIQILATGSSSFDLANKVNEPLTGRKIEFFLPPLSMTELQSVYSPLELKRLLPEFLIKGMYPGVVFGQSLANETLKDIAKSYTYKDVLEFQHIKNSEALEKLLRALALQIGNEVSYNELATLVGIDKITIEKYIRLLEQAFIIFRVSPYFKNGRHELRKLRKIYFYDTGLRNALLQNLNPLELRTDVGPLFENFFFSERMKLFAGQKKDVKLYFWRTTSGEEIDCIEEINGVQRAFEIKWSKDTFRIPKSFSDAYPKTNVQLINKENFLECMV